jgi:hypothetical protein
MASSSSVGGGNGGGASFADSLVWGVCLAELERVFGGFDLVRDEDGMVVVEDGDSWSSVRLLSQSGRFRSAERG